ncbi:PREDICTED: caffeoylshikimate esterase-like isoform X2 [Nelumbo nucifera]|uniref:Caffeoylshikimate esterase-like isoform X2 n=1 Tax=Nelumbo nucifera TaxID=4432 RepID=A0A1U8Q6P5_NELNU|nr:PREDICTED: caffeoylshikimate esterase-like isoform X2 [Nelumbo nucifera]
MELSLSLYQSSSLSLFRRNSDHLIGATRIRQMPIFLRRPMSGQSTVLAPIVAKKKSEIEGLSEEMNSIASQNLDFAPARRWVRSAFSDVQQKLDHVLFKTAPPGIRTEEWYEQNSRGLEIFCKSWLPKEGVPIKGDICFCHGYGDTCTFFFEGIAKRIAASGYGVYAMDYPGFGLSEGLHGYIANFDELVDDVIEQYRNIKGRPELNGLPRFILGQSMGGAVTLKVHLKQPDEWDGIVLVAPMCKAAYNVIAYSDQMRLKTAVELLKATKDVESQVEKVSSPLLVLHGAADKVTDPLVSKFLYEKASSKDKTLKLYEEGFHSILEGEPDDRILKVLDDIISWLDSRCALK